MRRSRRDDLSLKWELDLIDHLGAAGFKVPTVIESNDGHRHVDQTVVQHWLHGRAPASDHDWHLVAAELQRLHQATTTYPQRPGSCAVSQLTRSSVSGDADMSALPEDVANDVLGVFATVAKMSTSVIHGDPMAGNIRIDDSDVVGLLDFDESRVDVAWHDLSNLGIQVLDDADHAQVPSIGTPTTSTVKPVGSEISDNELVLRHLGYIGSHPSATKELGGVDVAFDPGGVKFARRTERLGEIAWGDVAGLSAFSERIPGGVNGPAVLLLGVLGFFFKNSSRPVVLRIEDRRGEWLFDVPGIKVDELRDGLAQIEDRYMN